MKNFVRSCMDGCLIVRSYGGASVGSRPTLCLWKEAWFNSFVNSYLVYSSAIPLDSSARHFARISPLESLGIDFSCLYRAATAAMRLIEVDIVSRSVLELLHKPSWRLTDNLWYFPSQVSYWIVNKQTTGTEPGVVLVLLAQVTILMLPYSVSYIYILYQ